MFGKLWRRCVGALKSINDCATNKFTESVTRRAGCSTLGDVPLGCAVGGIPGRVDCSNTIGSVCMGRPGEMAGDGADGLFAVDVAVRGAELCAAYQAD